MHFVSWIRAAGTGYEIWVLPNLCSCFFYSWVETAERSCGSKLEPCAEIHPHGGGHEDENMCLCAHVIARSYPPRPPGFRREICRSAKIFMQPASPSPLSLPTRFSSPFSRRNSKHHEVCHRRSRSWCRRHERLCDPQRGCGPRRNQIRTTGTLRLAYLYMCVPIGGAATAPVGVAAAPHASRPRSTQGSGVMLVLTCQLVESSGSLSKMCRSLSKIGSTGPREASGTRAPQVPNSIAREVAGRAAG